MNEIVDTFSNRLSKIISIRNIKPIELSEKTGIDKSKISSYMSGRYKAKQNGILILSKVLDVNPSWLMGYNVPMNNSNEVTKNKIPVFSTIKSEHKYLSSETILNYETINDTPNVQNYYALEISEDSMEPLFSKGDIAIVYEQSDFENGNTCVILIGNDEITIKKIIQNENGIDLISMNPYYPVRHFTQNEINTLPVKIIGKVVEARKRNIFESI